MLQNRSRVCPRVAAVTGGRGMVGSVIVKKLVDSGWNVRVLTRSNVRYNSSKISVIRSDITDKKRLKELVQGVGAIFHCAAELHDDAKMHSTNVEGTSNLLEEIKKTEASYFCFLSSAGVVGPTSIPYITEETCCQPNNLYEKTKYEAELLVKNAGLNMNVSILRPTNVVSHHKLGVLSLVINNSFKDRLKVLLKGNESAHVVHVEDVADTALYFLDNTVSGVNTYFVARDDDRNNIVGIIYNLYQDMCGTSKQIKYILPNSIPHLIRNVYRGNSLHGDVKFLNNKLQSTGFVFKYDVENILQDMCEKIAS